MRCPTCGGWIDFSDPGCVVNHAGPLPLQQSISRSKHFGIMKLKPQAIIYTILADDQPVAALEANGTEARELLKARWFVQELSALKVGGKPIYKTGTRLRARPATEDEWAIYDRECRTVENAEEILFVYLVNLDFNERGRQRKPSLESH